MDKLLIGFFVILVGFGIGYQQYTKTYKFQPEQCVQTNVSGWMIKKQVTSINLFNYGYCIIQNNYECFGDYHMRKDAFEALHEKVDCR